MNPEAKDLIIDWINSNGYKAAMTWSGNAIRIEGNKQIAWLYLEPYSMWKIKPGLYLLAETYTFPPQDWQPRELPSIGDPNYFPTLVDHLKNGPKPF
jgi:hypothetical protein